ncbi:MAG: hypothetical protein R2843_09190 [Thermomicrobiales bacterium]
MTAITIVLEFSFVFNSYESGDRNALELPAFIAQFAFAQRGAEPPDAARPTVDAQLLLIRFRPRILLSSATAVRNNGTFATDVDPT